MTTGSHAPQFQDQFRLTDSSMRLSDLESWVLSLLDTVQSGQRVEDSRVELKREWPQPVAAARRIAGHANAARGENVLWVVGLDEERGVTPVSSIELADWWSSVAAEFDGLPPGLTDLIVPTPQGALIALLFDSSRSPFVVRNPRFGTSESGSISHEVPWREGTKIGSARRDQLIRLLTPVQALPYLELMSASIHLNSVEGSHAGVSSHHGVWSARVIFYISPANDRRVVLPIHHAVLRFRVGDGAEKNMIVQGFHSPSKGTVVTTSAEAIFQGPGQLIVDGEFVEPFEEPANDGAPLQLVFGVRPVGTELQVSHIASIQPADPSSSLARRQWELRAPATND